MAIKAKQGNSLDSQLRAAIAESGLSAYALAKASGVGPQVIGRFLKGERDILLGTAERLAKVLNLTLEQGTTSPKKTPVRPKKRSTVWAITTSLAFDDGTSERRRLDFRAPAELAPMAIGATIEGILAGGNDRAWFSEKPGSIASLSLDVPQAARG